MWISNICSSFRKCIIMQSILCYMSLSVVVQKERKTYRRRRDILRGVRFFVSDLFQKRPSWRGRAVAGPRCLQKKKHFLLRPIGPVWHFHALIFCVRVIFQSHFSFFQVDQEFLHATLRLFGPALVLICVRFVFKHILFICIYLSFKTSTFED